MKNDPKNNNTALGTSNNEYSTLPFIIEGGQLSPESKQEKYNDFSESYQQRS